MGRHQADCIGAMPRISLEKGIPEDGRSEEDRYGNNNNAPEGVGQEEWHDHSKERPFPSV